jgi:hypothetical protein
MPIVSDNVLRVDYSSYNTAVDLLTALSDVIDENI